MNYISRTIAPKITEAADYYQVIVVTGPRQSGKTFLCRHLFKDYAYYNFEDIALRQIVMSDPKAFLLRCSDSVVIDEIQHIPELFSYIQIIVDEYPDRKFILTGSSNFQLLENISQSLAGRAALFTLLPFSLTELGEGWRKKDIDTILFEGCYPGVTVKNIPPVTFYDNYISTYVERDVRQIKNITDLQVFQQFIKMLAARVGSEFNASSLSVELGISAPTVRQWLSILSASYIAFPLRPFYANIAKRLVKTPKIYFYDTGLLCRLLNISTPSQLESHPLRGSIFENMAVIELLKRQFNLGLRPELYFYRDASGKEVDIVEENGDGLNLYEIKSSSTFNKAFLKNIEYLRALIGPRIARSTIIYNGETIPPVAINIRDL